MGYDDCDAIGLDGGGTVMGRIPTPAERSAHELLCGMYRRDLDARRELRVPLPDDHVQLAAALRALDDRVGLSDEAADAHTLAGEAMHRWVFWNRESLPALTQDDRTAGYKLADSLVTFAAYSQTPVVPRFKAATSRSDRDTEGPRGAVPRG